MKKNYIIVLFVLSIGMASAFFKLMVLVPAKDLQETKLRTTSSPVFVSIPQTPSEFSSEIRTRDGRVQVIEKFFKENRSPLYPYAKYMVAAADKYNIDFRLLPAIAMKESTAGKYLPEGSHNAWGYGIWGDNSLGFKDWEEGIDTVAQGLSENYIKQGLITPEQIMVKYTPPSIAKGGPWAKDVSHFMSEME